MEKCPNQSLCVGNVPQSFFYTRFLPHCVYYSDIIYLVYVFLFINLRTEQKFQTVTQGLIL